MLDYTSPYRGDAAGFLASLWLVHAAMTGTRVRTGGSDLIVKLVRLVRVEPSPI